MTAGVRSHRVDRFPGSAGFAIVIAAFALVAMAVLPALSIISGMWAKAEYSHAWLVIPLAVLLFIERFSICAQGGNRWVGIPIAGLAALLLLAGWATRNTTLSIYGGICGIYGVSWTAVGATGMRSLTAPILFLIFMIPLPLAVYITLSQTMQLVSSKIGVALMSMLNIFVIRDGNVIELANGKLEVAEACSGLRYLFPLLSIAFLFAVLLENRPWKKLVVLLSAFPIALLLNAFRLAMIGVLVDRFGIGMAEGLQHEVEGFAMFALCVGLLALEVCVLAPAGQRTQALAFDRLIPDRRTLRGITRWPTSRPFLIASAALAGAALVVCLLPARVEIIPDRRPLSLFPMSLPGWQGVPQAIEPQTLASLQLSDYVMADYVKVADGPQSALNFYVAYYASQRIGVQVHSPRLCIPGGGWSILDLSLVDIPAADGSTITANRVLIEKDGVKQLVYYWFEERGRRTTGEAENKVRALIDAVTLNRSDGALIRFVAPVADGDPQMADRDLRSLIQATTGKLRAFVPA